MQRRRHSVDHHRRQSAAPHAIGRHDAKGDRADTSEAEQRAPAAKVATKNAAEMTARPTKLSATNPTTAAPARPTCVTAPTPTSTTRHSKTRSVGEIVEHAVAEDGRRRRCKERLDVGRVRMRGDLRHAISGDRELRLASPSVRIASAVRSATSAVGAIRHRDVGDRLLDCCRHDVITGHDAWQFEAEFIGETVEPGCPRFGKVLAG